MQWKDFEHEGRVYSLDHLHPFSFDLVVPAQGNKPALSYRLNVIFSLHCFTRAQQGGEVIPPELAYADSRETRIFDFDRHGDSEQLPAIIRSLGERPCFHDAHGNFYVFEIVDANGARRFYSVFFTLSKAGRGAGLNLYVSSAHIRDERPYARSVKPIKFRVLVHNTWTNRPINPAP